MISVEALIKYREAFDTPIYYAEPSDFLVVEDSDGETYLVTEECDEAFLSRIEKSKEQKRNLILEKSRRFDPYPDKDALY